MFIICLALRVGFVQSVSSYFHGTLLQQLSEPSLEGFPNFVQLLYFPGGDIRHGVPSFGRYLIRPSCSNLLRASRIGVRLTPRFSAISVSKNSPGFSFKAEYPFSHCSIDFFLNFSFFSDHIPSTFNWFAVTSSSTITRSITSSSSSILYGFRDDIPLKLYCLKSLIWIARIAA